MGQIQKRTFGSQPGGEAKVPYERRARAILCRCHTNDVLFQRAKGLAGEFCRA